MRIAKWSNSLVVRLPVSLIKELDLREGEVDVVVKKKQAMEDILAELRRLREDLPLLPADFKFDREEANARGTSERDETDDREEARRQLLARLNQQPASGARDWRREELYEN
jgi:antitoxin MazE